MNVLILDHHFGQDIDALAQANQGKHTIRTIHPEYFAAAARKLFPASVFGSKLEVYHKPEYEQQRLAYREKAIRLLRDLYKIYQFDIFISPSDTFFYIRDVIDACKNIGVPFIVVQKELGVSAKSLEQHAAILRRWAPFCGDWMTTSSEKSRAFWQAAGANPECISVVGQPRFDVYRSPKRNGSLSDLGIKGETGVPVILFLSYDLDAYDEERALGHAHQPWAEMHHETEIVLKNVASSGKALVLIKPHPQQDADALNGLANRMKSIPNLAILSGSLDTRVLIMAADVVVGFQSTAIAEAMAAGKRVVYTFWSEPVRRAARLLLPFHELGHCIDVVRSPQELRTAVLSESRITEDIMTQRRIFVEDLLGPFDGMASQRVWRILETQIAARASVNRDVTEMRSNWLADAGRYCSLEMRRATRRAVTYGVLLKVTKVCGKLAPGISERLKYRYKREKMRIRECAAGHQTELQLVGRGEDSLLKDACRSLARRILPFVTGKQSRN